MHDQRHTLSTVCGGVIAVDVTLCRHWAGGGTFDVKLCTRIRTADVTMTTEGPGLALLTSHSVHNVVGSALPTSHSVHSVVRSALLTSHSVHSVVGSALPTSHSVHNVQGSALPTSHSVHSVQGSALPTSHTVHSVQGSALPTSHSVHSVAGSALPTSHTVHNVQGSALPTSHSVHSVHVVLYCCQWATVSIGFSCFHWVDSGGLPRAFTQGFVIIITTKEINSTNSSSLERLSCFAQYAYAMKAHITSSKMQYGNTGNNVGSSEQSSNRRIDFPKSISILKTPKMAHTHN